MCFLVYTACVACMLIKCGSFGFKILFLALGGLLSRYDIGATPVATTSLEKKMMPSAALRSPLSADVGVLPPLSSRLQGGSLTTIATGQQNQQQWTPSLRPSQPMATAFVAGVRLAESLVAHVKACFSPILPLPPQIHVLGQQQQLHSLHWTRDAANTDSEHPQEALLLVGFEAGETSKIYQLLKDLDGEFLKVIHFTEDMISLTVWDAMHVEQQKVSALKTAESLPRICIFSGLSGEEMMMFIDAFPEAGLETTIFAAMVPNSANKQLGEVIEEIMGDHEMMSAKLSD